MSSNPASVSFPKFTLTPLSVKTRPTTCGKTRIGTFRSLRDHPSPAQVLDSSSALVLDRDQACREDLETSPISAPRSVSLDHGAMRGRGLAGYARHLELVILQQTYHPRALTAPCCSDTSPHHATRCPSPTSQLVPAAVHGHEVLGDIGPNPVECPAAAGGIHGSQDAPYDPDIVKEPC